MADTNVKKRRVLARDHSDIANYISEEKQRREKSKWRRRHEERWKEVDRQIAMDPPFVIDKSDSEEEGQTQQEGQWHNAVQLGDLSDASEVLTADTIRLTLPTERAYFVPHVELPTDLDEQGDEIPVEPERQRQANGVYRNLLVQQQKDFGFRGRAKLALKEIFHHGSVVCTVEMDSMFKYHGGNKPEELTAPVVKVHSMWNCFPDPSPSVSSTELFYQGSMIISRIIPLQAALEMPGWINKDQLRTQHDDLDIKDHIEILTYYGDLFIKRHDGNVLFPNRRTTVSGGVFLESKINPTPYSPVIYTGYERDDVRDPYYTSPIVKRAPMAKFATHMVNRTMDAVDLQVDPPITYNAFNNSLGDDGPEFYPGAKNPIRGSSDINVLAVGDPATGLAALQFAKQSMTEGTNVDASRKGVAPGTAQTATEIVKTEQRAEVRLVEFTAAFEAEFVLPYLYMQHDLNLLEMKSYPFYNDEMHTPDFLRANKSDIPKSVVMEVTGSRSLLGEEQRTARLINIVSMVAHVQPLAAQVDWQEISRQIWEDTRVKDPERFMITSERNQETQAALESQAEQFQEQMAQVQQQVQQIQQELIQAKEAQQKAETSAQQSSLKAEQQRLEKEQITLERERLQQENRIQNKLNSAEDILRKILEEIKTQQHKLECMENEKKEDKDSRKKEILSLVENFNLS